MEAVSSLVSAFNGESDYVNDHYKTASMSERIVSLRLVLANGTAVMASADQHSDLFDAARSHVGALGIVTEVEYEVCYTASWLCCCSTGPHGRDSRGRHAGA